MTSEQLHDGDIQAMKELRANGWSLEGIARVYSRYNVTVEAVRLLVGERAAYRLLGIRQKLSSWASVPLYRS